MIGDVFYYQTRYDNIEKEFINLTDYIPLTSDFDDPNYKFGSLKLMDFSFKVCREIETIFRLLLEDSSFDKKPGIEKARKNQSMNEYRKFIEPDYKFHEYKLKVFNIDVEIIPFENFDKQNPDWFRVYSGEKHYTLDFMKKWNFKFCLMSLAALGLLVLNHPDYRHKKIPVSTDYITRLFFGKDVRPRYSLTGGHTKISIGGKRIG